jgi:hypothetical protein
MVFCGKPSKCCRPCRNRRIKVRDISFRGPDIMITRRAQCDQLRPTSFKIPQPKRRALHPCFETTKCSCSYAPIGRKVDCSSRFLSGSPRVRNTARPASQPARQALLRQYHRNREWFLDSERQGAIGKVVAAGNWWLSYTLRSGL